MTTLGITTRMVVGQGLFGGYPPPLVPGIQIEASNVLEVMQKGGRLPRDIIQLVRERMLEGHYRFERKARPTRPLGRGDLIAAVGSGGGGYGDPLEREPRLVEEDVRRRKISPWAAQEI